MVAGRCDSERLSDNPEKGRGRALIVVLLVQVLVATVFIVLVATDSLPIPGADHGAKRATTTETVR